MSYHTQLFHEEFYFLKKNFPTTFTRDFTKLFGKKKSVSSNVYQSFFDMCWAHSLMPKSVLCMRRESGKLWNFLLILIKSSQYWIYLSYASRLGWPRIFGKVVVEFWNFAQVVWLSVFIEWNQKKVLEFFTPTQNAIFWYLKNPTPKFREILPVTSKFYVLFDTLFEKCLKWLIRGF